MTTNEFLPRKAVNPNGRLGSFYDCRQDQLFQETTRSLEEQAERSARRVQCSIENCNDDRISNLLKKIHIDDELRLSIASQMVRAEGVADLINATGTTNRFTRLLSYSFIDRTESFTPDNFQQLISFDEEENEETPSVSASHFVALIKFGIEVHILLQLPPNDNEAQRIDAIFRRGSISLCNSQPVCLVGDDERLLRKMSQMKIFSNAPELTQLKSIVEFFQRIDRLKNDKNLSRPCEYELCPVTRLFSIEDTIDFYYRPIDAASAKKIEEYLLCWFVEVENLRKQIDPKDDKLDKSYQNELERIRKWISDARQSLVNQSSADDLFKSRESIAFRHTMAKFGYDVEQAKAYKEYFKSKAIPKEFECRPATNYVVSMTDDQTVLEQKLVGTEKNLRVFCGSFNLYNENFQNWNKFCDGLLDEQKQNPQLKVIFVDFTDHPYPLGELKIFSSNDPKPEPKPDEIPSTPSTPTRIKLDDTFNILLLGESGVGKSTFINALLNYLHFESFAEVEEKQPIVLLSTSFGLTSGVNHREYQIDHEGLDASQNEVHDQPGQSVTQCCRSYLFTVRDDQKNERRIRLIDTPGLNDVRGIDQDEKNVQDILEHIDCLSHLHAICIILRPTVARLTVTFRSSLMQIFHLLGDKIRDNVLFCFTHTRSTFYSPGNTGPVLRKFLESLPIERIPFGRRNTFCFDSESLRYLLGKSRGVPFQPDEVEEYKKTWQHSLSETKRLLRCITTEMKGYNIHHSCRTKQKAQLEIQHLIRPMIKVMTNLLDRQANDEFASLINKSVQFGHFLLGDDYSLENDFFVNELNRMIGEDSNSGTEETTKQLIDQYSEQMATMMSETEFADLSVINRFIDELHEYPNIRSQMRELKKKQRSSFQEREFPVPISELHFD